MRRAPFKALFALLTLNREAETQPRWDRIVLLVSGLVTAGLAALYVSGKATGRW